MGKERNNLCRSIQLKQAIFSARILTCRPANEIGIRTTFLATLSKIHKVGIPSWISTRFQSSSNNVAKMTKLSDDRIAIVQFVLVPFVVFPRLSLHSWLFADLLIVAGSRLCVWKSSFAASHSWKDPVS